MKNFVFFSLLCIGFCIWANQSSAQLNSSIPPDAEYSIDFISETECQSSSVLTAEIWVTSYAEHGIACAFVDLTTNLSVISIVYGEDYTVFNYGDIDDSGISNLGGCSFTTNGNGLNPDWSLVAIVEFEVPEGTFEAWSFLEKPSHLALSTSIYGEGTAMIVDYGDSIHCAVTDRPNLSSGRKSGRKQR